MAHSETGEAIKFVLANPQQPQLHGGGIQPWRAAFAGRAIGDLVAAALPVAQAVDVDKVEIVTADATLQARWLHQLLHGALGGMLSACNSRSHSVAESSIVVLLSAA